MNTGHEGSMTTVHANTARDALAPSGSDDGDGRLRHSDARACGSRSPAPMQIVVQARRLTGGKPKSRQRQRDHRHGRRADPDARPVRLRTDGVDANGHAIGRFSATGIRPRCASGSSTAASSCRMDLFARRVMEAMM